MKLLVRTMGPFMPKAVAVTAIAACFCSVVVSAAEVPAQVTVPENSYQTVILVRHAEKADAEGKPSADQGLSPAGKSRAIALAEALKDAGVTAILTTSLQRTIQTAQPIAALRQIAPRVVALQRTGQGSHIDAVVAAIRAEAVKAERTSQKNSVVLVVGHSNTVPAIVGALGGPLLANLCESDHAGLFILTIDAAGGTRVIRSKYGQMNAVISQGVDAVACK